MSTIRFTSLTPQDFKVGKQAFRLGANLPFQGDLAEFHECSFAEEHVPVADGGTRFDRLLDGLDDPTSDMNGVLKVALSPLDNDLLSREAETLVKLFPPAAKDEKFYRYFARPIATFDLSMGGVERKALVTPRLEGYRTLTDVRSHFPTGLDFRDVVWMFKRGLSGLGFAHFKGLIHGAVLPPHVMVHPTGHGAKLIDWAYSVPDKTKASAMSRAFAAFYAPEVAQRDHLTSATDIFMLAKCAVYLLGGNLETNELPPAVPVEIQAFFHRCLVPLPNMRPQNAWDLHDDFDALLRKVVGKPAYRPLTLPKEAS